MRKLNICYLTQQYGNFTSGVGTYSTNLINSIAERGYKVIVICPKEKEREFASPAVRLIEVERKKWDPSHGNWFTLSIQFSFILKRLIKTEKIDIVHFTDARECFFSFFNNIIKKDKNIFTIGTVHDDIFISSSKNIFLYRIIYNDWIKRYVYYNTVKIIERSCLNDLDTLIAVSNHINRKLTDIYKIDKKKITTIYNGIFFNCKNSVKIKNNIKKDNHILIIGNNLQGKGIITLFKAFNLLDKKYSDLKIIVIGSDKNQKYLENYALKIGIKNRIEFNGKKTNSYIINKMKTSLMYVMPSLREGFGITFLEAMSSGLPVIGGNVGGTKELIKDGENGFLVNHGDYKDLSGKISVLLDDDEIRKKFINNGLKTVNHFSVKNMVDKTYKMYTNIFK